MAPGGKPSKQPEQSIVNNLNCSATAGAAWKNQSLIFELHAAEAQKHKVKDIERGIPYWECQTK